MVRAGVGVVRDARASKPSFTSTHPAGAPTCCPSAFGGSSSSSLGAFGRCHTPFPAARELSSDLRSFSHTPDASR